MRLAHAAEQRWRNNCPCCGTGMRSGRGVKKGRPMPGNVRTEAHDVSVARGGDNRDWLYACYRCNNDQGWLSFAGWARMLLLADDKRAERVAAVAFFVAEWRAKHGFKRRNAA